MRPFYRSLFADAGSVSVPGDDYAAGFINHYQTPTSPDSLRSTPSGVPWHTLYYQGRLLAPARRVEARSGCRDVFWHALSIRRDRTTRAGRPARPALDRTRPARWPRHYAGSMGGFGAGFFLLMVDSRRVLPRLWARAAGDRRHRRGRVPESGEACARRARIMWASINLGLFGLGGVARGRGAVGPMGKGDGPEPSNGVWLSLALQANRARPRRAHRQSCQVSDAEQAEADVAPGSGRRQHSSAPSSIGRTTATTPPPTPPSSWITA